MIKYNVISLSHLTCFSEEALRDKDYLTPLSLLVIVLVKKNKTEIIRNLFNKIKHLPLDDRSLITNAAYISGMYDNQEAKYSALSWAVFLQNHVVIEILRKNGANIKSEVKLGLSAFDLLLLLEKEILSFQKCFIAFTVDLTASDKFKLINHFANHYQKEFHRFVTVQLMILFVNLSWDHKYILLNKKDSSDKYCFFANQKSQKEYMDRLITPYIVNLAFKVINLSSENKLVDYVMVLGNDSVTDRTPNSEMLAFLETYADKPFEMNNTERLSALKEKALDNKGFNVNLDICPISQEIPNIPVKVLNQIYDFCALINVECDENGMRKNPTTRELFQLSDVRPASEYQLSFEQFCKEEDQKLNQVLKPLIFSTMHADESCTIERKSQIDNSAFEKETLKDSTLTEIQLNTSDDEMKKNDNGEISRKKL